MARHGMEKLSWLPIQLPFLILTPDTDFLWESFNLVFKLPHSRRLEGEADLIGVHLMAAAGFDPREAPRMFRLLNKNSKIFEWTSTHPVGESRAEEVNQILSVELRTYEEHRNRFGNEEFYWPDLETLVSKANQSDSSPLLE